MRISVRNAVDSSSEAIEKHVVAGRTVVRLAQGQRLEIVDEKTGQVPANLRARRGGKDGEDLILESNGEIVEIEGFFAMAGEGEEAVVVEFPGGEVAEITPASAEFAGDWAGSAAFAMTDSVSSLSTMAQGAGAAGASSAGASSAGAAAGGAAAGASSLGWGWIALGGLAAAGVGAAIADDDDDSPAPAPQPEPEREPTFALSASADEVDEGTDVVFTLSTTNVAPGTQYEYVITGISAADVEGGKLSGTVTIGADGKALIPVSLLEDLKTEGVETLKITIAGQTYEVTVNDTSLTPEPTFELSASAESVDEGSDVVFTLTTTNVAPGTQFEYQLSGVSAADIVGGRLTGTVTIDANGQALIPVSLLEDLKTEGAETLKITIAGQTYEVTVNDTSLTPEPTFALSASAESVDEGADVVFTLTTTNVAPGTQFEYQISGVSAADVAGGKLTGTVTIDANGRALIPVSLLADLKTEGVETLKITIAGQTYEVTVNDTSLTPAFVLTEGLDDIKGEAVDDVVYGNAATYNAGDKIDGGEGHDTLNLSLASGTKAESVTVKSVETVNITTTAGEDAVELTMTNYEGVEQINVHDARSDLSIVDQQDLWDVSITDTDRNVSLDYDSQVVAGKSDALNVAVREFTGNLAIDPGVEVLDLTINDGVHEDSAFGLQARGVTEVKLSGGVAGQEVAIDLDINHPGEDHDHAAGATFDARDFVGDLTLTNLEGGERTYSAALEITQGLEAGQTATVTIGGKLTITVEAGEDGMTAEEVATALALQLDFALGTSGDAQKAPVPGSNDAYAVIIKNLHAPGGEGSTVEIAGTAVEIKTDFDYGDNLTDEALNKAKNSEVSKLVLGDGNDTGLKTEEAVRTAFEKAAKHSKDLLVEKHVEGRDHRITVCHGKAVWAIERVPAGITGDGERSVRQLIEIANRDPRRSNRRWGQMKPLVIDEEAQDLLKEQGLTLDSVLPEGKFARLRRSSNISSGGTPMPVNGVMHPDNAELAVRAARVFRLDIAGVDLITPDITRSWREVGGAICEVNGQPQLSVTAPHIYGELFDTLIEGQGRIPTALVLSTGGAEELVQQCVRTLAERKLCVGLSTPAGLFVGGACVHSGRPSALADARALLIDPNVDAVVLVADGKEFLQMGLPFDRFDVLAIADWQEAQAGGATASRQLLASALELAKLHCTGAALVARGDSQMPLILRQLGEKRVETVSSQEQLSLRLAQLLLGKHADPGPRVDVAVGSKSRSVEPRVAKLAS